MRQILFFAFLLMGLQVGAQKPQAPYLPTRPLAFCGDSAGMTPSTAIAVCGSTTFHQSGTFICTGVVNIPHNGCPGDNVTSNSSYWYKFHCFQTGTLGFSIRPITTSDDFDWELFDITNAPNPDAVLTSAAYQISLNIFGNSAASPNTGCSSAGTLSVNCSGNTLPFNVMPTITAGNDYLLMVTNWAQTVNGYNLNFSGGTAVIADPTPPLVSDVQTGCDNSKIKVVFSKDVLCNTVTASGSEFTIMPGNIPISSTTSQCAQFLNSITSTTLNLATPLPSGNYTLMVNIGTDLNTFKDACGNEMVAGAAIPFTINAQATGTINNVSWQGCAPTVLNLRLTKPIFCNSLTATGSEFSITPGNVVIISASSPDCASGALYTKTIQVTLQNALPSNTYQLFLNNGTDGNTLIDTCNIAMPAGATSFVVGQTPPPIIQSIGFNECHPDQIIVDFDKPINCNSIASNTSDFSIVPGNIPISTVFSNCVAGGYTSEVILYLQNPLPAGNFSVQINNGTDGNTIADTCLSFMTAGYIKSFVATQAPVPVFDSVVYNKCNPSAVRAYYRQPILCNTVSADGSEFFVTGPSSVSVVSAATDPSTCANGYTRWIDIQFAQPINLTGTYTLHNNIGTDLNGIVDTCFASQSIAETIAINASAKPSAAFTNQVHLGCNKDTIILSHPGGNSINSWTWNFSDNTTGFGQNITHLFLVSTPTATIQLIVSNGQCPDTSSVSITLGNSYQASFTTNVTDTSCLGTAISFTNTSTGNNLSYEWDFGDNTTFNGPSPAAHTYAASNSYPVNLAITDGAGCKDTATHTIVIAAPPIVDFVGLNTKYCSGDIVRLTANIQGNNVSNYTWDNGDGKTFSNQQQINFSYANENNYTISLTVNDRYCGQVKQTKTTQVYLIPVVALGNDTTFCPGLSTILGAPNNSAYTYLWSTGGTTAQITTDQISKTYKLTASNNGCTAAGDIKVKVLLTCLIKVPNAFTPNSDGLNDQLKAINADLAKNFSLSVYNRLGQRVFFTRNPLKGWDGFYKGQPADSGAYVWQVSYIDPVSGKAVFDKGSSLLIR